MANTQSMCTSFLGQLLTATHNFGASPVRGAATADTFKAALYFASATLNASTTVYSNVGEVTGTNYGSGGINVPNANAPDAANTSITAGTGYWTPSAALTWTSVTITTAFDTVLIYNSTQGNKAVSVHTFGSQTISAGNITIVMPDPAAATALLRLTTT